MLQVLPGLARVVSHTLLIYLFLVLAMSLLGHRQTSELGIVELVVIMVLGSAVETAMIAGDTSLLAGLASAATLLAANRGVSLLLDRLPRLRHVVVGRPIVLVYRGRILKRRMREAGLTEHDILEAVRERGYARLSEVRLGVLEIGGAISVIPADGRQGLSGKMGRSSEGSHESS